MAILFIIYRTGWPIPEAYTTFLRNANEIKMLQKSTFSLIFCCFGRPGTIQTFFRVLKTTEFVYLCRNKRMAILNAAVSFYNGP